MEFKRIFFFEIERKKKGSKTAWIVLELSIKTVKDGLATTGVASNSLFMCPRVIYSSKH